MKKILIILTVMQVQSVPEFSVQSRKNNLEFLEQHFSSHKDKSVQATICSYPEEYLNLNFTPKVNVDIELIISKVKTMSRNIIYSRPCGVQKRIGKQVSIYDKHVAKYITKLFGKSKKDIEIEKSLCEIQLISKNMLSHIFRSESGDINVNESFRNRALYEIEKLIYITYNEKKHKEYLLSEHLLLEGHQVSLLPLGHTERITMLPLLPRMNKKFDMFHSALCMLHSIEEIYRFQGNNDKETQVAFYPPIKLARSSCSDMTAQMLKDCNAIWLKRLCLYRRIVEILDNISSDLFEIILNFIPQNPILQKLCISNNLFDFQLLKAIFQSRNVQKEQSQLNIYFNNL